MTAADWISDRRTLIDAATEGPWDYYRPHPNYRTYQVSSVAPGGYLDDEVANCDDVRATENAALIADARTSLPAALDALEAVLELHRRAPLYEACEDEDCEIPSVDHDEVSAGEWVHITVREGEICVHCSDLINDLVDYPCETVAAITAALGIEVQS